jgi:hypothetical protein
MLVERRIRVPGYGRAKREWLNWLADNPLFTKRFAFFVGRRGQQTTVKEVAGKCQYVPNSFVPVPPEQQWAII